MRAITLLTWLLALPLTAANYYVRDGGSGSGTSWSDAADDIPSVMTRGDTYYVADGTYGTWLLNDAVSGSSYITIKKATTSDHGTETGWNSAYGDGVAVVAQIEFATAYWWIDGGATGATGDQARGLQVDYNGIWGCIFSSSTQPTNRHHLTLKNVEMTCSTLASSTDNMFLYLSTDHGSVSEPVLWVENCFFKQAGGLNVSIQGGSYLVFTNNFFQRSGLFDDSSHKEIMKFDHTNSFVRIVANEFKDWHGYAVTGGLILGGGNVSGTMTDWLIANNVFWSTNPPSTGGVNAWSPGNRVVGFLDSSVTDHDKIYVFNNTFYGVTNASAANIFVNGTATGDCRAWNNLFVSLPALNTINKEKNWNAFYSTPNYAPGAANDITLGSSPLNNPTAGDFTLTTAVAGTNLSGFFTTDKTGAARSSWDVGAFEYSGVASPGSTITFTTAPGAAGPEGFAR